MAKIYHLIICSCCYKRLKENEEYVIFEDAVYCESCFELYTYLTTETEN